MKKKLSTYLSLLVMISSFITTPLIVLAETTSTTDSTQQTQADSTKTEEPITQEMEVSNTSQVESLVKETTETTTNDSATLESTQTDQKQASETTQSTDMQTRGSPIDDSGYTKLILSLDPPRSENKYYTGENIQFYQTIESSNEQVNEGLYSLIKIPKKFVDKDTIKVNADTSIKNYQIIENEADEWVIRIDYKTVVNGGIVAFPITFQQRNYTTPPDSETKVLSELFYESKLLSTDSFSVYANTVTPSLTKNVHSNYIKNGTVNIGLASKDDKNVSSKNKNELNTILYDMRATIGTKEGNGIFINNNSEIVDVLPETTKFDEMSEYSNNWEYDSKNNTISFKITKDSKIYNGSVQALLPVYFPDTEGGKSVSNTAELRDINNITVSDATTKFIPSIEPNEPYISGGAWKYAQGETYNRAIGEQPDEITWTVYPYISDNPFNKQAYIKEIEDIVDENQYYTQFKVSMPKNTSFDFIDFYAAKEDGVYKLIQEKIPTDEDILISRDYRKIKIVYRTPVLFDKDIRLYPKTKVKDKIWESKMDGKSVKNTGKVTYTDPEGNKLGVGSTDANVTYSSPKIQFFTTIEKEGSGLRKEILGNINDIVNINYQVSFKNVSAADEPTIVTILPSGVVPNSEIKNGSIVNNYLGTGQTAILQKVTERKYERFSSDIPVKLTKSVSKGLNKIQHYIYWENQKITPVPAGSYNQRYSSISKNNAIDFDNQGTFLGKDILSDYDEIDYYPPLEVMILKKIGTTPQSLSENPIEVEASQDIYYELSLENRTNKAIEDYYFYDILPFKGDKLTDQQNNSDRGSTDNVLFSQIVSKDSNLDVYYSSENQIDSINDFTWYKLDSNTSKENIKTLKFVPTVKLEPNQVMKVLFRVSTASNSGNNSILNSALLTQKNKNTLLDSNIVEAKVLKNETTEVKGTKTWNDANNQDGKRPDKITVNLLADGVQVATKEVTEADGWRYEFKDLPKFKDGNEIVYTVTENQLADYNTEVKGFNLTNSYTPGKTSISVTKKWEDANNQDGKRPNSIQVQLLADGQKQGDVVELNAANNWTTTWNDLAQKANGKDISYTVEEVAVPGYTTTVDDTDKGNVKLTNTHTPETTEVKGTKTWNDANNQDGKRPDKITVNLLADGVQVATKEVTEADGWRYEFKDLPKFKDAKEIVYTVTENQVADYNTEVKGFDLTNSYTPGKTSVSVTKKWEDANNQDGKRPNSIQVKLLADGKKQGNAVELNAANNWTTTWNDLAQKANGKDISYTVEEVAVPGYTTTVDDTDKGNVKLTNTHTPETTEVKGTKTWNDANNQDGKRPDKITVNLLADGAQVATKEVTEADGWRYEFKDLPKFKDAKEIVYTVTENQVADYNTEVKGFDLTNSYTPGKTSVSMTKKWEDANNQDGKRPNSIQVKLLADGKKQGNAVELNAANNWTTTWNDLAQKANGKDISYTVEEVAVPGYTTTVDDTDKGNVKLTNTHTPETTEVKGTKTWNDANNQDGKRPDKITVNLLADGAQVATKEVTEADGWRYEFKDLPKFKDAKEIVYTVTENQVADYNTEVKGFDLTNSYTPGKTSVSVTKKWEDANNQDGKRPNSIQVKLLADGKKQGNAVELNAANNWTTTWNDLAQKANGKDISYTVEEVAVPGYTTTVDDTDKGNVKLTNTHTPETTEVKGTKTWNDANNQDGKRPDKITVNLLADGAQVATKEVTEADGWRYEFKDLPKFKDAKEIVYTVTENQVADYNTEVKGFDLTNSYTPGKTSVSVTKKWEDANNQDGKRPNSIQVKLLADGKKQGNAVELNAANNWTTTWNDLAQKANGKDISYTVEEVAVPGYTTTVDDTDKGNVKLTNTHTPETTEVKGTKTWNDANNQDGKRPDKITVNLLADGAQVATKEVTEADGWRYEFKDLPKFKDAKEIVYTVTENQVADYNTEVKGFDLTNSYTPGKTSVSVTKKWEDANNQDGKRPNSIQVKLLADGKKQGDAVELNAANNWTATWNDLAQKANGKDISYTVEEVAVPGYTTTVDDTDKGNVKLTNTHTPETPNKPTTPTKPETPSTPGKHLPKTGEINAIWWTVVGTLLISSIGGYLYFRKKVKR